ncbi:2-acylglycerol O-acyltransferase 2 isoform X2 [Tribolium castaneum]|uniref:2-acylglycerol O-acyltransferase 2 isoform X2 n=1 Tax=Tribolium castaneum TaxID=7070 RepID=UPI00077DEAD4|nr:PREDICTED: 2-acylglycerol O-acyltransferase 2 isoform X2 [Tribolium castaneum]|eukprot:XP_975126.3 PREDICTED: 2-acylglycerol O-acyltransferase 2 isoform X2 [Tribolium castaneum]
MRFFGINFDHWNTPCRKRLQFLAAGAWMFTFIFGGTILLLLCFYLLFTPLWWLVLINFCWIYYDRHSKETGGKSIEWIQNWKWFKYTSDYFLITLKLAPGFQLDPNRNYLFACFPHGVLPAGLFHAMSTKNSRFRQLYKDFSVKTVILTLLFYLPFTRELILAHGAISSSTKSINYVLSKPQGGQIVLLFPGVKKRKGFVRLALQNGAPLVPVITFGENDLYNITGDNYCWEVFQNIVRKMAGFTPILFNGRGIFQRSFGLVPLERPLMTVLGKPIEVTKVENPSEEQIKQLHQKFQEELVKLFDKYKYQFFDNPQDKCLELE